MRKISSLFFDRLCYALAKHRVWALAVILAIMMVFLFGTFKIKGEVILAELFPYDHAYLKLSARFTEVFGGGGTKAIIGLKANKGDIFNERVLTKIQAMTKDVNFWEEIYRYLTTSMASNSVKVVKAKGPGVIVVEPLMYPHVPQNEQQMEDLKRNIYSNPSYRGTLVSEDGTACLLATEFKEDVSYERAFDLLNELKSTYTDEETTVHIVGFPMLMGWVYSLKSQTYMVFGISIAAIALVLILICRNFAGMFAPLINAGILTILGLGFTGFTGINFSPLLYVLAFLVGARMIGNSQQIAYRYFEELDAADGDRTAACYKTMKTMWIPNFAAVISDVAGFAILFVAKIILMKHLSIIMSFWIGTIVLTSFLVPVVCSVFPFKVDTSAWSRSTCQQGWIAQIIRKVMGFAIGVRSKWLFLGMIACLAVFCVGQMTKLKIGDPTPGSPLFFEDHPYNKDQALINKIFNASSESLTLYFEGEQEAIYDPVVFGTLLDFDEHMKETLPDIYKTSDSLINLIRIVNETYHEGDKLWYDLPRDPVTMNAVINTVKRNAGRGTLNRYVGESNARAQITLFFADHSSDNLIRIRNAAYAFFEDHPMQVDSGEFILAGGSLGLEIGLNEEMKRAHLIIDSSIYVAIFVLCTLCYRSVLAGLMLTLPLIFANAMSFAFMSIRDIGLSINTLPVAAIGAGLGLDFAIYLYSRCIEEFPLAGRDWLFTITQAVCTCGKAIVYTGVAVILPVITWWFFSDMKFQAEVGFFICFIMAVNVVLALTLHPLMIYLIKPKFISKGGHGMVERDIAYGGAGVATVVTSCCLDGGATRTERR